MPSWNVVAFLYRWPQSWQGQGHCDPLDFLLSSFLTTLYSTNKHMIWQIEADYVFILMDLQKDYNYTFA